MIPDSDESEDPSAPPLRAGVSPCSVGPKLFHSGKRFQGWRGTRGRAPPARDGFRAETVATEVAHRVLSIVFLSLVQAASMPALVLLFIFVAFLVTWRSITKESSVLAIIAVCSLAVQFSLGSLLGSCLGSPHHGWEVVEALLCASGVSIVLLLAIHGPQEGQGNFVDFGFESGNKRTRGQKSRGGSRGNRWDLRDSSYAVPFTGSTPTVCCGHWYSSKWLVLLQAIVADQVLWSLTGVHLACSLLAPLLNCMSSRARQSRPTLHSFLFKKLLCVVGSRAVVVPVIAFAFEPARTEVAQCSAEPPFFAPTSRAVCLWTQTCAPASLWTQTCAPACAFVTALASCLVAYRLLARRRARQHALGNKAADQKKQEETSMKQDVCVCVKVPEKKLIRLKNAATVKDAKTKLAVIIPRDFWLQH